MQGLIQGQMNPQGQAQGQRPQEQRPQGQQQAQEGNGENDFKLLSGQMVKLFYSISDQVVEAVKTEGPDAIKQTLARIMIMAINSMKLAGKTMSPDIVIASMMDLTKAVAEILVEAKVIDPDPQLIEEAFFAAVSMADSELQKEAFTPEEGQQYAALMQKARAMQQQHNGANAQPMGDQPQGAPPQSGQPQGMPPKGMPPNQRMV